MGFEAIVNPVVEGNVNEMKVGELLKMALWGQGYAKMVEITSGSWMVVAVGDAALIPRIEAVLAAWDKEQDELVSRPRIDVAGGA